MASEDDPKFSCPSCGTEFRWKPEIVGCKAKCKCGATIEVPEHPTLTPIEDPFEQTADEDDGRDEYDVIEPPPQAAAPRTVMPAAPPMAHVVAPGAPPPPPAIPGARKTCPVCNVPALPTAPICINCGFNFLTGQGPRNRGADAAVAERYYQCAKAAWAAPLISIFIGCCAGGALSRVSPMAGLFVGLFQLLLIGAGVGLGIYALTGMKKVGRDGILVPAMVGLTINAIIILLNVVIIVLLLSGAVDLDKMRNSDNSGGGGSGGGRRPPGRPTLRQMAPR